MMYIESKTNMCETSNIYIYIFKKDREFVFYCKIKDIEIVFVTSNIHLQSVRD